MSETEIPTRYTPEFRTPLYTPNYNYKCPECGGEFMMPVGEEGNKQCPFCGREMKG